MFFVLQWSVRQNPSDDLWALLRWRRWSHPQKGNLAGNAKAIWRRSVLSVWRHNTIFNTHVTYPTVCSGPASICSGGNNGLVTYWTDHGNCSVANRTLCTINFKPKPLIKQVPRNSAEHWRSRFIRKVTLFNCFREMRISNLDREIGCTAGVFCGFPHSFKTSVGMAPQIRLK
jgi:hypothetical protein